MPRCDCCRFRSEASQAYDPVCAKSFFQQFAQYEKYGGISITSSSGTGEFYVSGGSGGMKLNRTFHTTISSSGAALRFSFMAPSGVMPSSGVIRGFFHDWTVEMDWANMTLKAYSCDEDGQPSGAAWYEQDVTNFWNADLWYGFINLVLTVEIGMKPNGSLAHRYIVVGSGVPVANKMNTTFPSSFWVGMTAEHDGDDLHLGTAGLLGTPGLVCSNRYRTNKPESSNQNDWYCPQLPMIYETDPDAIGWSLTPGLWSDPIYLIPVLATGGRVAWRYANQSGSDTSDFTIGAGTSSLSVSPFTQYWGITGTPNEVISGSTISGHHYFAQGDAAFEGNPDAGHKPGSWACGESEVRSIPVWDPDSGGLEGPDPLILTPHGLTTPANPP